MTVGGPISLLDIARAIEAVVDRDDGVAGLDRSGRAVTVGPGKTVKGVRVERTADGEVFARLEVIGLAGTILTEAGDRLRESVEAEFARLGLTGTVMAFFTDLADAKLSRKPEVA